MLLFLLVLQTWFIDGLIIPCQIAGGSMALALLGEHRDVVCADCGFHFACDSAIHPVRPQAVCPNCGFSNNIESLPDLGGDRVLIDRSAFQFHEPNRWDVVAFRHPYDSAKILIKRVVGLPGESVEIKGGNVYIDGHIQRKSLEQQLALAVPVYDTNCSPSLELRPISRWKALSENSLWKSSNGQFTVSSNVNNPDNKPQNHYQSDSSLSIDWLEYNHWRRISGKPGKVKECPITDIMAYNHSLSRREEDVHDVNELLLSFDVLKMNGKGKLFVRANYGENVFQLEIDPTIGTYCVNNNSQCIAKGEIFISPEKQNTNIVVSMIDQQYLFAFNNKPIVCIPIDNVDSISQLTGRPFAIGSSDLTVAMANLCISRDIYYTTPLNGREHSLGTSTHHLMGDEYYVLGDNSSIAEDSRTWIGRYPVVANLLIGKPLVIAYGAKMSRIGSWQFQVPDLGRIGYIR